MSPTSCAPPCRTDRAADARVARAAPAAHTLTARRWHDFNRRFFFWELLDMLRKLFLTSFINFIGACTPRQPSPRHLAHRDRAP